MNRFRSTMFMVLILSLFTEFPSTGLCEHRSDFYKNLLETLYVENYYHEIKTYPTTTCEVGTKFNWRMPNSSGVNYILERFSQQYPELVQVQQIGESVLGQVIYAVRITDNKTYNAHKPVILIDAAIHGREEMQTTRIIFDWMDYIINKYISNPTESAFPNADEGETFQTMLEKRVIWLIPMLNPDGADERYCIDFADKEAKRNANCVNLAGNFPYLWTPSSLSPQGRSFPLSEPETRTLDGFAMAISPSVYLNMHGFTIGFFWEPHYQGSHWPNWNSPPPGDPNLPLIDPDKANWYVTSSYISYECKKSNDGTYYYDVMDAHRTPNNDVLQWVYRTPGSYNQPIFSLPVLAEQLQEKINAPASPASHFSVFRNYAPYTNLYADYNNSNFGSYGRTAGAAQAFGTLWARHGAISLLHEAERFEYNPALVWDGNGERPDPRCLDGSTPEAPHRLHRPCNSEEEMQKVIKDAFFPLTKIVMFAENPIPNSHPDHNLKGSSLGASRHNLAVSGIHIFQNGCELDLGKTYWPINGRNGTPMDFRNGYFGTLEIECEGTNYGNQLSADFDIKMAIADLTDFSRNATKVCYSPGNLSPTHKEYCSSTYEFLKGHQYRVTCSLHNPGSEVTYSPETDPATIDVTDDQACKAWFDNLYGTASELEEDLNLRFPECVWDSGNRRFDSFWGTNNTRYTEFSAALNAEFICSNLDINILRNLNGYLIGHIVPAMNLGAF